MSRPTKYTAKIANSICLRLAGGESLRSICKEASLPDKSTVLLWVVDGRHPEFSDQYRTAREAAGYAHADRLIDIVDRIDEGELEPARARAMADSLKWCAERMAPKAHSIKQDLRIETTHITHEEALKLLA